MTLVFDIEVYKNFFLASFKDVETGRVYFFQESPSTRLDRASLDKMMSENLIVGFNSRTYDLPITELALTSVSAYELYAASYKIIVDGVQPYDFYELYNIEKRKFNHIDLMGVAPLKASLKIYSGRLHTKKMQDLPVDPNSEITAETAAELKRYNVNDLDNTILLWNELAEQIKLREALGKQYDLDLRSKSDAQMGEAVIGSEIAKIIGFYPKRPKVLPKFVMYDIPANVRFESPRFKMLLEELKDAKFYVKQNGQLETPDCLNTVIRIGGGAYRMGIGGLHSSESSVFYEATDNISIADRDVVSFYPNIILDQNLYPAHLGPVFVPVYRDIVTRRLAAKRDKRKVEAESLKIVINGSFGKLGSMWSILYSPQLLIQTTVSGQLYLMMLIEMLVNRGIEVISANTDGIVMLIPKDREEDVAAIVKTWEQITRFDTEEARYKGLYSRDVNNYIAIKEDGSVKTKGAYANPWEKDGPNIFKLHKNPVATIAIEAVIGKLRDDALITETVKACKDIRKFVCVRAVSGGATKKGVLKDVYIGKAVRWYYAKGVQGSLSYAKRKAKVNNSDGGKPVMELPDTLPDDIDYGRYYAEAHAILQDIGYLQRSLF